MKLPMATLGEVCRVIPGFAFKSSDLADSGIPVVKIGSITDTGSVDLESGQFLPEPLVEERHEKFFLNNGDVVLAMTGEGKVGRIRSDQRSLLNQRVCKLEPLEPDDDQYLWVAVRTINYARVFAQLAQGAAQANISGGQLESLQIPWPQKRVRGRIAETVAAYDDLMENNRRRMTLLEEAARQLYREWFVRLRFPGHEHTRITNGVPEGWEREKVGNLLAKIESKKKIPKDAYLPEGPIPCVDQSADFIGGFTDEEEAIYSEPLPVIVFGDHTRVLKFVNFPFARGADGTQVIYPNTERTSTEYLYLALKAIDLSNYFYARHFKFLKEKEVLLPEPSLVREFNVAAKPSFEQVQTLRLQNQKLRAARDLLLPRLMSGEIAV